jgi:hypothetical protein
MRDAPIGSRREIAPRQEPPDVAQVDLRGDPLGPAFAEDGSGDLRRKAEKLGSRQPHTSATRSIPVR